MSITKNFTKALLVCTLGILLVVALTGCDAISNLGKAENATDKVNSSSSSSSSSEFSQTDSCAIEVQGYGTITVGLDANAAPITVENFKKLVNEGFYNGLTFHRIISGFVIQGGDPNADGTGGSSEKIKGEFTANGVNNNLKHVRGAISMARSSENDSASSQFFIVQETSSQNTRSLDGKYACFGYVTEGMEIVDQICANVTPTDNNGTVEKSQQPVITSIKMLEE